LTVFSLATSEIKGGLNETEQYYLSKRARNAFMNLEQLGEK
jgi:hypothetical protein